MDNPFGDYPFGEDILAIPDALASGIVSPSTFMRFVLDIPTNKRYSTSLKVHSDSTNHNYRLHWAVCYDSHYDNVVRKYVMTCENYASWTVVDLTTSSTSYYTTNYISGWDQGCGNGTTYTDLLIVSNLDSTRNLAVQFTVQSISPTAGESCPLPPTPLPTPQPTIQSIWTVVNGPCKVNGLCISSSLFGQQVGYNNNEICEIVARRNIKAFNISAYSADDYDFLSFSDISIYNNVNAPAQLTNGNYYRKYRPHNLPDILNPDCDPSRCTDSFVFLNGDSVFWQSDGDAHYFSGWKICAIDAPQFPPSSAPTTQPTTMQPTYSPVTMPTFITFGSQPTPSEGFSLDLGFILFKMCLVIMVYPLAA